MASHLSVGQIDEILDELEVAARAEANPIQFTEQLVDRLRACCHSTWAACYENSNGDNWECVSWSGTGKAEYSLTVSARLPKLSQGSEWNWDSAAQIDLSSHGHSIAVAVADATTRIRAMSGDSPDPGLGARARRLVLALDDHSDSDGRDSLTTSERLAILDGFADVLTNVYTRMQANAVIEEQTQVAAFLRSILESQKESDCEKTLVDGLRNLVQADRVTLVRGSCTNARVSAISGIDIPNFQSETALRLGEVARNHLAGHERFDEQRRGEPDSGLSQGCDDQGLFACRAVLRLEPSHDKLQRPAIVVAEWSQASCYEDKRARLQRVHTVLEPVWSRQVAWLELPVWMRTLARGGRALRQLWMGKAAKVIGFIVLLGLASFAAQYKIPLWIEVPSILEPTEQSPLFASHDGYVEEVLCQDGEQVEKGQILIRLRSPGLEHLREELSGKMRAIAEKRNGLRVALNQVDVATREGAVNQTRLSGEVAELDVEEQSIRAQLGFVQTQIALLDLRSSISGRVLGADLKKELSNRPVRRGDALLRIANVDGAWHLRMRVADRDTALVLQALQNPEVEMNSVEYVVMSDSTMRHTAEFRSVADTMESRDGSGPTLDILADLPDKPDHQIRVGAEAIAFVKCDNRPLWFVWCRPMVEYLRQRWWFAADQQRLSETQAGTVP